MQTTRQLEVIEHIIMTSRHPSKWDLQIGFFRCDLCMNVRRNTPNAYMTGAARMSICGVCCDRLSDDGIHETAGEPD